MGVCWERFSSDGIAQHTHIFKSFSNGISDKKRTAHKTDEAKVDTRQNVLGSSEAVPHMRVSNEHMSDEWNDDRSSG